MPFATTAKNVMLDALTLDHIKIHNGLPGAAGTDNPLLAGVGQSAVFDAAASGSRALNAAVAFTGLAGNAPVTHFSVWTAPSTFRGSGEITTGDTTANGAGEFNIATGTTVAINDA